MAEGLVSHGIHTDLLCRGCSNESESIGHVLFLCPPVRKVWEIVDIPPPSFGFSSDIHVDMSYILDLCDNSSLLASHKLAIPWILWDI